MTDVQSTRQMPLLFRRIKPVDFARKDLDEVPRSILKHVKHCSLDVPVRFPQCDIPSFQTFPSARSGSAIQEDMESTMAAWQRLLRGAACMKELRLHLWIDLPATRYLDTTPVSSQSAVTTNISDLVAACDLLDRPDLRLAFRVRKGGKSTSDVSSLSLDAVERITIELGRRATHAMMLELHRADLDRSSLVALSDIPSLEELTLTRYTWTPVSDRSKVTLANLRRLTCSISLGMGHLVLKHLFLPALRRIESDASSIGNLVKWTNLPNLEEIVITSDYSDTVRIPLERFRATLEQASLPLLRHLEFKMCSALSLETEILRDWSLPARIVVDHLLPSYDWGTAEAIYTQPACLQVARKAQISLQQVSDKDSWSDMQQKVHCPLLEAIAPHYFAFTQVQGRDASGFDISIAAPQYRNLHEERLQQFTAKFLVAPQLDADGCERLREQCVATEWGQINCVTYIRPRGWRELWDIPENET